MELIFFLGINVVLIYFVTPAIFKMRKRGRRISSVLPILCLLPLIILTIGRASFAGMDLSMSEIDIKGYLVASVFAGFLLRVKIPKKKISAAPLDLYEGTVGNGEG